MELFCLKFTYLLLIGGKLLYSTKLSITFCIWVHQPQTYLKFYVHGLENRHHLRRKKRKQAVFEMDLFREAVCSSFELEVSK